MITDEYVAGFFDGEGSVYAAVRHSKSKWRPSPTVLVCISNTCAQPLEMLKAKYGGSIHGRKRHGNRKPQYQWVLGSRMAYPFLKAILPHLIIKKEVTEAAITLCDLLRKPAAERNDYSKTVFRRGRKWVAASVRPEFAAECWKLHDEIRRLNKRGAPNNAMRRYDA